MKIRLLTALVTAVLVTGFAQAQTSVIALPANTDMWQLAVMDGAGTLTTASPTDTSVANMLYPTNDPASWLSWFLDNPSSSVVTEGDALKIVVGKADDTAWHSCFLQRDLPVSEGVSYVLKFRAKASASRLITPVVQVQADDYHPIGFMQDVTVGTDWQTFSFPFTAAGLIPEGVQLAFQVGQATGTLWLADVALSQASGACPVPVPSSALQVNITQAANPDWKINLFSKDQNFVEGKKYTLSFSMKSQKPRTMAALPQVDGDDYRVVATNVDFRVNAGPVWHRHTVTFTAVNVKPNAVRIVMPVGQTTGNIWIGDVKVTEAK